MKVFISVDMEGVSGVVAYDHTSETGYDYELARRWMMGEANAAVEGALAAGADEVVVSDSHGANGYRNLRLSDLHPEATLVSGFLQRPLAQMEGMDATCDAFFLIGYHVRQGSFGVISHTTVGGLVANVWLNGLLVGECGLNAALAGHFGVPTVLISGDGGTVEEVRDLIPGVEGAVVKQTLSQGAARCLSPVRAQAVIREAARRAVERRQEISPFQVSEPATVRLQYKDTSSAESAMRLPDVMQVAPDTVEYTGADMVGTFKVYHAMVDLGVRRVAVQRGPK
ncbi:MAG: M55 family metallopeptidase [Thermaerobacterales bacterium]